LGALRDDFEKDWLRVTADGRVPEVAVMEVVFPVLLLCRHNLERFEERRFHSWIFQRQRDLLK
jgi:hypothetical protein